MNRKFERAAVRQPVEDPLRAFLRTFRELTHAHRPERVFEDFVEMAALAIANRSGNPNSEAREARYMEVIGRYGREEAQRFPSLLAHITQLLTTRMQDAFGKIWGELELGSTWKGQFFTPYEVSLTIAKMTLHDVQDFIDRHGFVTICEPACGPGGMIVAAAECLRDLGIDYQQRMHATLVDIDPRCAWMAYIQMSLLGIPAIVQVGNSLALTVSDTFYTPAHIQGGWSARLRAHHAENDARERAPQLLQLGAG